MAKALLIMDMPESCVRDTGDSAYKVCCPLVWNRYYCSQFSPKGLSITGREWEEIFETGKRPDWCPLKPMPEKNNLGTTSYRWRWFKQGWNACIDKILGKNEVKNESIKTSFRDNR